jgi:predicted AlkP superfamily phosphohydrolase/phosphomutase
MASQLTNEAQALWNQLSSQLTPEPVAELPIASPPRREVETFAAYEPPAGGPSSSASVDVTNEILTLVETISAENVRLRLENVLLKRVEIQVVEQAQVIASLQARLFTTPKRWWKPWR